MSLPFAFSTNTIKEDKWVFIHDFIHGFGYYNHAKKQGIYCNEVECYLKKNLFQEVPPANYVATDEAKLEQMLETINLNKQLLALNQGKQPVVKFDKITIPCINNMPSE